MDKDRSRQDDTLENTTSKLDGTNLVSKSNDITDSKGDTTQNLNSNDITEPNNTKIKDDTTITDSKDKEKDGKGGKDEDSEEKIVVEDAEDDESEEKFDEEGDEKPGDFDDDF